MSETISETGIVAPTLRSFVDLDAESHFPIQNLPLGVFVTKTTPIRRVGVAIGAFVLDLAAAQREGLLTASLNPDTTKPIFEGCALNALLRAGDQTRRQLRHQLVDLLGADNPRLRDDVKLRDQLLLPQADVAMLLPVEIGDYTDFYSSRDHATNVGTMMRGADNALQANWLHLPVGYHGRSSSIVVDGTPVRRPCGQTKRDDQAYPVFGPSKMLDYELELGFVGAENPLGVPIPIDSADEFTFGMVLVNDWSARDVQKWEYVPLGPFLAKNFATTISPWVVPMEALAPFRVPGPMQDPEPLPYLRGKSHHSYDIHLEAWLQAENDAKPTLITNTNAQNLYWTFAQQLAHHTCNGCNVKPGDLLASGTISGPTPESRGCMLERTWRGSEPIQLAGGQTRRFLEDGDTLTLTGWCQGDGYRIGFGAASGKLLPATNVG